MKIFATHDPAAPVLGRCAKVRGRRHRRCHRAATTVLEYVVQGELLEGVDHPEVPPGRVTRRWAACPAHAQQAQRHGAKAVVKVR